MSGKKTGVWAIVLLMLAGFYYFYEIQGEKSRRETARQKDLVAHLSVDEVTGLSIKRAAETLTAAYRDGHWYLTEPLAVAGDDQKIRELIQYAADLHHQRVVDEHPQTLEPFGLAAPAVEVHLQRKTPGTPLILRLGEKNPTGSGYYAQVEGQPAVYLLSTAAKDILDASLFTLRDKTVVAFALPDVQEIELAFAAAPAVSVQRQGSEQWQLTAPVNAPADTTQVQTVLRNLREAKVQAFVEENPADLEPFGLQTPALRLVMTVGQDRTAKTLLFGRVDPERKGIYAKRSDAPNVLLLPQQLWDNLPKTASALREKTLLRYERDHVARLEWQSANEQMVIVRTGARQYQLEQPVQTPGDGEAIYGLLWDLKELKVKEFIDDSPARLDPYGLTTPRLRITLWEESADQGQATRQHILLFGNEAPEQQGTYVQLGDRPAVYLVESSAAQKVLGKTSFELRYKKLLAFESASIQKLQLQYPALTLTLERRGDAWQFSEPNKQTIDKRWKVDDLLYELRTLEYAKLLTEPAADQAGYGLETPQVRIRLWQKDGSPVGPLIIGKAAEAEGTDVPLVYAQVGSTIYAIKAGVLEKLPKTMTDLTAER